jgi:hypothetical protein
MFVVRQKLAHMPDLPFAVPFCGRKHSLRVTKRSAKFAKGLLGRQARTSDMSSVPSSPYFAHCLAQVVDRSWTLKCREAHETRRSVEERHSHQCFTNFIQSLQRAINTCLGLRRVCEQVHLPVPVTEQAIEHLQLKKIRPISGLDIQSTRDPKLPTPDPDGS